MIKIKTIKSKKSLVLRKIQEQRKAVLGRLKRLQRDDPFKTNDRSLIVEPGTDAAMLSGHEQVAVLEGRLKSELKEVERALKKIKKGTYGKCENCKKTIESKRLKVKPSAIYCLSCEMKKEASGRA